jgi:hypothetical protein
MTRLTLRELERDTAEGTAGPTELDNPFLAVRIELDAKSGLRMYKRRGERLREPTPADRRRFGIVNEPGSPNLPDGRALGARNRRANLLVKADRGRERRAELDRAFGPPAGRVRGFDRYVITRQDDVDEVLVDPSSVLPVELNTVRAGQLVSHVQMGYEATKGGVLVRKSFRSERSVPDGARRVVTSVDLSNVDVQAGGGQ